MTMAYRTVPAVDRFNAKTVAKESGCIEWTAARNNRGYGTFRADGRSVMAHRWSYEHYVGPIPDGLDLDHLCRNRRCVNPAHLEPVTTSVNLLRAVSMGQANAAKTHCPAGHSYSGDNLYNAPSRKNRMCRTCRGDRKRQAAERAAI